MIYGIGTDLVDIDRIRGAMARHGERFLARLLSDAERLRIAELADPAPFVAKRWAAKEAFAKALGTGVRPPVSLAGVTVMNNAEGRPVLEFDDAIAAYLAARGIDGVHVSLSDEQHAAIAFVVLESRTTSQL
jgi:holo-[acyl-carrier protein] synthase